MKRWLVVAVLLLAMGCQSKANKPAADNSEGPKFEIQGFVISRERDKYVAREYQSDYVAYRGSGKLVVVSPSPSAGRNYRVWLQVKETCGNQTSEWIHDVIVLDGVGTFNTFCEGSQYSFDGGKDKGDIPQQPPTYEWGRGGIVWYVPLQSAPLTVRK